MAAIKVSASILCADFTQLKETIHVCENSGVDMLHVDVMDGHFVPNITIGAMIVEAIRPITKLPIDVHLMIEHPTDFISDFINAGADMISMQAECYGILKKECRSYGVYPKELEAFNSDLARKDVETIHRAGKKAFMVINPKTELCIDKLLPELDGVLIMSVNPGFAKQKFMPEVLPKLSKLRGIFKKDIAIDGGINDVTAVDAVKAGANILATASYFFGAIDKKEAVRKLKALKA